TPSTGRRSGRCGCAPPCAAPRRSRRGRGSPSRRGRRERRGTGRPSPAPGRGAPAARRTPRARPRRASRRRRARRPGGARASSGELLLELGVRVGRLLAQQVDLVGEALEVRRVVRVAVVEVADELGLRRRALAERGGDLARRLGDTALVVEVLLRRLVLVAELGLLVGELADAVLRRGELRARGLELRVG